MERKLVTVRKVGQIKPIEGADKIELAMVDGWQCIINKGDFKEGDLGIYFEIDSFLPIKPEFEFLRKSSYKKLVDGSEGFRLKTIKLKGQLSQGLLLPLSSFPEKTNPEIGRDYSEYFCVIKYDPPIPAELAGQVKGNFPTDIIPKTDQERIQNLPDWFETYSDEVFEVSEKIDGSSTTYYFNEGVFGVCSRNLELKECNSTQWKIAREYDIENKLKNAGRNLALQGELVGPGINGNSLKLKKVDFFVFDIYDIDKRRYLLGGERLLLLEQLKLKSVPILYPADQPLMTDMAEVINYAIGKSVFGDFKREGLVCKSIGLINGQVISFKVINNEYYFDEKGVKENV